MGLVGIPRSPAVSSCSGDFVSISELVGLNQNVMPPLLLLLALSLPGGVVAGTELHSLSPSTSYLHSWPSAFQVVVAGLVGALLVLSGGGGGL